MNDKGRNRRPVEPPDNDLATLIAQIQYHSGEIVKHRHGRALALEALAKLPGAENLTREEWLSEHPVRLRIEARLANYLEEIGIHTVKALLETPAERLRQIPGFGEKMEAQLFTALAEVGFVRSRAA